MSAPDFRTRAAAERYASGVCYPTAIIRRAGGYSIVSRRQARRLAGSRA